MTQPVIDRQRVYDAMLIKGFRKDVTIGMVNYWLKPYNISTPEPDLKRQPPAFNIRVRVFLGECLKPLADRLWDTTPDKDINTLNWMANLECQRSTKVTREINKVRREIRIDEGRTELIGTKIRNERSSNQWDRTKTNMKLKRVR
jgi:hypothetical protein